VENVYSSPTVPTRVVANGYSHSRVGEMLVNNFPPLRMFRQFELKGSLTTEVDVDCASVVTVSEVEVLVVVIVAGSYEVKSTVWVSLVTATVSMTDVMVLVVNAVEIEVEVWVIIDVKVGVGIDKHEQALEITEDSKAAMKGGSAFFSSSAGNGNRSSTNASPAVRLAAGAL
jgi:hypothetical protein